MLANTRILLLAFCILPAAAIDAIAGNNVNVRGLGMGRTAVASATNLDAIGVNPANLSLRNGELMTFSILPVGGLLTSDFFSYDIYKKYFQSKTTLSNLPEPSKNEILSMFGSPVGRARGEALARLFGLALSIDSTKALAFTIDYGGNAAGKIPREYARFLLFGNSPGTNFRIDGVEAEAYWHRTYTVSYGMMLGEVSFLKSLSVGIGLKLVQGYGYFSLNRLAASLSGNPDGTISGSVSMLARRVNTEDVSDPLADLFQSPAGYGFGMDLGLLAELSESVYLGLSVTDVGSIRWTREIEELSLDSTITITDPNTLTNVRSLANSTRAGRRSIGKFTTRLPGMLHLGIAARIDRFATQFPGELLVGAEYSQSIGVSDPMKEEPRLSLGVEYKPVSWLPIRSGFVLSGSSDLHVALGFGFVWRALSVDLATEDITPLFSGKDFSTGSLGAAIHLTIY